MVNRQNYFVFATLFLLLSLIMSQTGLCLQCFQCGEPQYEGYVCKNDEGVENAAVHCPEPKVCVRHWISGVSAGNLQLPEVITKLCAYKNYCSTVHQDVLLTKECKECRTDYCN